MKFTGLEVFDSTIQVSNAWLKDLMQELNWSDRRKAYIAFRSVLHAWRDHLPTEDAARLGIAFPTLLRGVYFERWRPWEKTQSFRSPQEFLTVLSTSLENAGAERVAAERIVKAVFRLLERKVADGEMEDIERYLPATMRDLWPSTLRAA